VSQASNGHEPSAPAIAPTVRARRRAGTARGDLRELQRLVRVLEHHVAVNEVDVQRDLELLADPDAVVHAEPRLRAVTALLVSLSTYRQVTAAARARPRRAVARGSVRAGAGQINGTRAGGVSDTAVTHPNGTAGINGGQVNGRYVNGTRGGDGPAGAGASDRELAAATARYIARDLAARQLSEFTSAEGYRLARSLARLGGVEEPVERLLAEANKVRLHPMPLADAVSHSPLGR
jgi:hypothetical protein